MVDKAQALETISFYAGNRFDLVQAGGGNTSAKTDNTEMLVKASGINLSEVTRNKGYVPVDYQAIRNFLASFDVNGLSKKQREAAANDAMSKSIICDLGKPSIETFLHALLETYTLHTHPVSVNILAATSNWREDLLALWPDAICVPYHTPGIDLALAMAEEMNAYMEKYARRPKVVFLQNHGLIVSSTDPLEVISLTDEISLLLEQHTNIDLQRYRQITKLQQLMQDTTGQPTSMICNDDAVIQNSIGCENPASEIWPFCPDTLIYCGVRPVFLNNSDDKDNITNYIKAFQDNPKVLVLDQQVYFCAPSLKKARDAQDLFRFHLLVSQQSQDKTQRLPLDEIAYLSNWDAEKYRQGI